MNRELVRRCREDVSGFASTVGWPLTPWQAAALKLDVPTTVIVAARQVGKSYSLATLAAWAAFRAPGTQVLIVSAGEDASRRLLSTVRQVCAHPMLAGSVIDEGASLVRLSNGSEVRSVPASERQVRGWSVDLLLVDEAALVPDDLLFGAALPTTMARPDARIVLASSPWAPDGAFYRLHLAGLDAANPTTRTFRWPVTAAPWVTSATVEHLRQTLPPLRFRAEVLGEFVGSSDAFLTRDEVLDAVAPYRLLPAMEARGEAVVVGLDWGRRHDWHAVACVGVLDDHDANPRPVLFVPWLELSQRSYAEQVDSVAGLARKVSRRRMQLDLSVNGSMSEDPRFSPNGARWAFLEEQKRPGYTVTGVLSEANGVGAAPSEAVADRMKGVRVASIHTSATSKESAYGRLRFLLAERALLLPEHEPLIRQLAGLSAVALQSGSVRIEAANPAVHDDAPDALSLALSTVPAEWSAGRCRPEPDGCEWVETAGGVRVPVNARPRRGRALQPAGAVLRAV